MIPLGLALSGGGFRATLFHLGVIKGLRTFKYKYTDPVLQKEIERNLLDDVSHITSVSGGSVLAAHMVLNWKAYTGTDDEFEEVSAKIIELVKDDVRGNILRGVPAILLRRLLLKLLLLLLKAGPSGLRRDVELELEEATTIYRLEKRLRRLYKGRRSNELLALKDLPSTPKLFVLGTNLSGHCLCSFTKAGFEEWPGTKPADLLGHSTIKIAEAVAASAAFPALFRPLNINRGERLVQSRYIGVSDAGIYDNLGISRFREMDDKERPPLVLVSDATKAPMKLDGPLSFLENLFLAVDFIHDRSKELEELRTETANGTKYRFIKMKEDLREAPQVDGAQHLNFIRTDLDEFNDAEIQTLVKHGYCVAFHTIKALIKEKIVVAEGLDKVETWSRTWPIEASVPKPVNKEPGSVDEIILTLQSGARHRWNLFRLSDKDTWFYSGCAFVALALFVLLGYSQYCRILNHRRIVESEKQLQKQSNELQKNLADQTNRVFELTQTVGLLIAQTNNLATNVTDLLDKLKHYGDAYNNTTQRLAGTEHLVTNLQQQVDDAQQVYKSLFKLVSQRGNDLENGKTNGDILKMTEKTIRQLDDTLADKSLLNSNLSKLQLELSALKQRLLPTLHTLVGAYYLPQVPTNSPIKELGPAYHGLAAYPDWTFESVDYLFDFRPWAFDAHSSSTNACCNTVTLTKHFQVARRDRGTWLPIQFLGYGSNVFLVPFDPITNANISPFEDIGWGLGKQISLDLSSQPVGKCCDVWVGAYLNQFQPSNSMCITFDTFADSKCGSLLALLGQNKSITDLHLEYSTNQTIWFDLPSDPFTIVDRGFFYAQIQNIEREKFYRARWSW